MSEAEYRIGGAVLRPRRELLRNGTPVAIGGRALAILSLLAERGGALVTKDELHDAVWENSIVEENALQAQVSAVRKALGEEAQRLVTVHGRGYRLTLDPPARSAPDAPEASIAVLPFENRTGSAGHAYLADGLAEELIATLARVPGLKVPARTSSFAYRDRATDIRTIASELGVATVLEGSVRADGERLRVGVQLIDAGSGFTIWSESFDRTLTDLLDLQDDLAGAIAGALRRELGPRLCETGSAEAMRLVLEARAATRSMTIEGMREAVRLAQAALDLDPDFAKAWESLAGSTYVMANNGFAPAESFAEARGFAEKAVALDPGLSGAHGILAGIEAAAGRMVEAVERLDRAAALEPGNAVVDEHGALSTYLPTGLIGRAIAIVERSILLGPARPQPHTVRAICAAIAGDVAGAARHLDDALRRGQPAARPPVEALQSGLALAAGDFAGAAQPMARLAVREFAAPNAAMTVETVYAALGGTADPQAASEAAQALFDAADRSGTMWAHSGNPGLVISWQVRLGAFDAAFAAARRLVEHWRVSGRLATGSLNSFWLPDLAPFRRDPRFQELVRELDLFRFWQRHGPPDGHAIENDRLFCL